MAVYLSSKLPFDLIEKINKHINRDNYLNHKWQYLYNKTNITKHELITHLHSYHDYAREIGMFGRELFRYNYYDLGKKIIDTSVLIHRVVSILIQKTISIFKKK